MNNQQYYEHKRLKEQAIIDARNIISILKDKHERWNKGICGAMRVHRDGGEVYTPFMSELTKRLDNKSAEVRNKWFMGLDHNDEWIVKLQKKSGDYGGYLWDPDKTTGRVRFINETLKEYLKTL